jgi:hypothetical protein
MPFKSKAQRRKFAELLVKGEISPETYEEWNRETGRAELPERVKPKPKKKAKKPVGRKKKSRRKTVKRTRSAAKRKTATRNRPSRSRRTPGKKGRA